MPTDNVMLKIDVVHAKQVESVGREAIEMCTNPMPTKTLYISEVERTGNL